jgi:hypothetical protein
MSDGNSIVNLGDLTKPATTLIEKISDAAGVLYEPRRIKRLAKAEAAAEKIKLLSKLELTEIEQRAMKRFVAEETIKQQNVENIIGKALPELSEDAKPEDIENDWLTRFFEESKLVSDDEMQSLWAKLLAGEANKPGTFSKRTINLISSLDKSDAELFTSLCSFCMDKDTLFIYTYDNQIYQQKGITFATLTHLDAIGLIMFNANKKFIGEFSEQETVWFDYFGTSIQVQSSYWRGEKFSLNVGHALLTKFGKELVPICGAVKTADFLDYCIKQWKWHGHTVSVSDKPESG